MKFTLPLPPPINQTYKAVYSSRLKRTVFFMSYPAKKWKTQVEKMLALKEDKPYFESTLTMQITLYLNHQRDIDSGLKIIMDVLQGIIYKNDSQITKLTVIKKNNKAFEPKAEIEVHNAID